MINVFRRRLMAMSGAALMAASLLTVPAYAQSGSPQQKVSIGYYAGLIGSVPFWVARSKGFYKEEGLDVDLVSIPNPNQGTSALVNGSIDFMLNGFVQSAPARDQGIDLVFIAGQLKMWGSMLVRNGLKLPHAGQYPAEVRDLKGTTWGVAARGSEAEFILRRMALDAGLDPNKDITWVTLGNNGPAALAAVKAGTVDVVFASDPAPFIAQQRGFAVRLVNVAAGQGMPDAAGALTSGIATMRRTAQKRPELIAAMLAAHAKAYCWIQNPKNFDELVELVKPDLKGSDLSDAEFKTYMRDAIKILAYRINPDDLKFAKSLLPMSGVQKAGANLDGAIWQTAPRQNPVCSQ